MLSPGEFYDGFDPFNSDDVGYSAHVLSEPPLDPDWTWNELEDEYREQFARAKAAEARVAEAEYESEQRRQALTWLLSRAKRVIEGKPVCDLDEVFVHVESLLVGSERRQGVSE